MPRLRFRAGHIHCPSHNIDRMYPLRAEPFRLQHESIGFLALQNIQLPVAMLHDFAHIATDAGELKRKMFPDESAHVQYP